MQPKKSLAVPGLLLLFLIQPAFAQAPLRWQGDLETAQRLAAETNRLVLIHFWADWCKPCLRLEQQVFNQPGFAEAIEAHYIPVKLHADQSADLARKYDVSGIPTDVVLTPSGQVLAKTKSPATMEGYLSQMNQIASTHASQPRMQLAAHQTPINTPYGAAVAQQEQQQQVPPYGQTPYGQPSQQSPAGYAGESHPGNYRQQPSGPHGAQATGNPGGTSQGDRYAAPSQPADRYGNQPSGQPYGGQATPPPHAAPQPQRQQNPYMPQREGVDRYAGGANGQQMPAVGQNHHDGQPAGGTAPGMSAGANGFVQQPQPQVSTNPYVNQQPAPQPPVNHGPPSAGSVPVGLDGYCPIALSAGGKWVKGDPRWGAIHRGRTYLFTGQAEQQKFLANPDQYSPVLAGNDPVAAIDKGQSIDGKREHGVFYGDRIYLFSSEESLQRFSQAPERYINGVQQAMQPRPGQMPPR